MFTDLAEITVKAGNGGNGCVSFRREKYVAAGGPDGGDGGRGGSIVFQADDNLSTLSDFRYRRKYTAPNGEDGRNKRSSGKSGGDLIIRVPRGTLLRDAQTGRLLKDISDDEPFVAAKGGRGGWGNQHFATPTRQVPRFARSGEQGPLLRLRLELKLLADVGLAGFPNVGKSSLLARVSEARPNIANYHFTTLSPVLGVVRVGEGTSFVMADIPGLIEGASGGAGLGHEFLRHIDRCRLLVHVVDVSGMEGRDPKEDFETIQRELAKWDASLPGRPMIVAGNKADLAAPEQIEAFAKFITAKGLPFFAISAATGDGVQALLNAVAARLAALPPVRRYEPEPPAPAESPKEKLHETTIVKQDGVYVVEGGWLQGAIGMVDPDDPESLQYMQRVLRQNGVFEKLEEAGIQEGDTVRLFRMEFEYVR